MIRDAIEAQARSGSTDTVALESLRADVSAAIDSINAATARAREFAQRGLVSEAASVIEDFPDLMRQAEQLRAFPTGVGAVPRFWAEHFEHALPAPVMPSSEDVDELGGILGQAARLRALLDALRLSALRREPITNRLAILKKLREADPRNRQWLDQIEAVEKEWLKRIGDMRTDSAATREEMEEAFTALSERQWIASVPRGLKDELYAKLKPMRAGFAGERYRELAQKIHDAAGLMDRAELEKLEAEWAGVYHETGQMPADDVQALVASAFEWLARVVEDERAEREFDAMVDELERALDANAAVADIERRIAALRDSGRSVPEGVLSRAHSFVSAERARLARKHRVVLVSSLLAAAVLVAGVVMAVTAYSRSQERASATASLKGLVERDDAIAAHELAEQIRAKPELVSAEMTALLSRADQLFRDWNAERKAVAEEGEWLDRELGVDSPRARLKELDARVKALAGRAKTKEESITVERLAQRVADLEAARDAADAKTVDAVFATVDSSLRNWPLPDRWTPMQQVDQKRWNDYIAALERAQGELERVLLDVAGCDVQEARIKLRVDGGVAALDEARGRREELVRADTALRPERIGAPFNTEEDFVNRMDDICKNHGAVLARRGRLTEFESYKSYAASWASIREWRDVTYPVVKSALERAGVANDEQATLAALAKFKGDFPRSPYERRIVELERRFDPAAQVPLWTGERTRSELAGFGFAGLDEVPLKDKRFYYRRSLPDDRDPLHRAVETFADLRAPVGALRAKLIPGNELAGGIRPSEVSGLWGDLERRLGQAADGDVQGMLLKALESLRTMQQGELFFRARALKELAGVLKRSGHMPPPARKQLEDWLAKCDLAWSAALSCDFIAAPFAPPGNVQRIRLQAAEVVDSFPPLNAITEKAQQERMRAAEELIPMSPIGVLLPANPGESTRCVPSGEREPDGTVVLVGVGGSEFVVVEMRGGRVESVPPSVPAGPVIVFRRNAR